MTDDDALHPIEMLLGDEFGAAEAAYNAWLEAQDPFPDDYLILAAAQVLRKRIEYLVSRAFSSGAERADIVRLLRIRFPEAASQGFFKEALAVEPERADTAAADAPWALDAESDLLGVSHGITSNQAQWHQQWWFIILCFLLFWPAGMALLWLSPVPKKGAKVAVTAVTVAIPLLIAWAGIASLYRLSDSITGTYGQAPEASSATAQESSAVSIDDQLPPANLTSWGISDGESTIDDGGTVTGYLACDGMLSAVQVTGDDGFATNARSATKMEGVSYTVDRAYASGADVLSVLKESAAGGATVYVDHWTITRVGGELFFTELELTTLQSLTPNTETDLDPKTATRLAAGTTPEQALDAYNAAMLSGQYEDAFWLLPLSQRQSYGSPAAYAEQMGAYGITASEAGEPLTSGDEVVIANEVTAQGVRFYYTWTYVRIGDDWFVKSRVNSPQ